MYRWKSGHRHDVMAVECDRGVARWECASRKRGQAQTDDAQKELAH